MATDNSDTTVATTNIVIAAIVALIVVIIILSIIVVIICVVRKKSRKHTLAITGTTADISMYTSPAYGTHHVFSEPGLDHLYDRIDDSYREKSTTLQDPPQAEDDEVTIDYIKMNPSVVDPTVTEETEVVDQEEAADVDDYIKMNSSCKVDDQVVSEETESNVDDYMDMNQSSKVVDQSATDEYVQPAGDEDLLPTGNDNQ